MSRYRWKNVALVVCILLLVLLATACAARNKVQDCIKQGGHPHYTTDKYGNVIDFLGCEQHT